MSKLFIALLILLTGNSLVAQVAKDSELYRKLKTHDSLFFERSFNHCDISYLHSAIDNDLRFYHDKGGIQDRDKFLDNVKRNLCSDTIRKLIRKVDAASLEVFPMYNNDILYGALQTGVHSFYIREKGKEDVQTGVAKFIHLYLLVNDNWILREVISYDHQPAKK